MAKKQKSFAEKASSRKAKKDLSYVKLVKSVKSDKEGHWRFKEKMIGLEKGENIDAALKRMEDQASLAHMEMPVADKGPVAKDENIETQDEILEEGSN